MDNNMVPYEPPKPQVQWGAIILTGVSAALLVILAGLFVQQVGKELDKPSTPAPTATPEWSYLALRIPFQGTWSVEAAYELPDGQIATAAESGIGEFSPTILDDIPAGVDRTILYRFHVIYTAPDLLQGGLLPLAPAVIENDLQYRLALEGAYFAVYDTQSRFLEVVDNSGLKQYSRVNVQFWQAPVLAPIPTPMPTEVRFITPSAEPVH